MDMCDTINTTEFEEIKNNIIDIINNKNHISYEQYVDLVNDPFIDRRDILKIDVNDKIEYFDFAINRPIYMVYKKNDQYVIEKSNGKNIFISDSYEDVLKHLDNFENEILKRNIINWV